MAKRSMSTVPCKSQTQTEQRTVSRTPKWKELHVSRLLLGPLRALVPRCKTFLILVAQADVLHEFIPVPDKDTTMPDLQMITVTPELTPTIERARSGYGQQSEDYLCRGHRGYAVLKGDALVGLAWLYINARPTTIRLKRCFPIPPHTSLLHADWVHPEHRGKGIQKLLLYQRARYLQENCAGSPHGIAYVNRKNKASLLNFCNSGFEVIGELQTLSIWRFCLSWRKRARSH